LSEYKKEIGAAVTIALVGALSLAILASSTFPLQPSTSTTTSQVYVPGPSKTETSSMAISTTNGNVSVPHPIAAANLTMAVDAFWASPQVLQYIGHAYSYSVGNFSTSRNGTLTFVGTRVITTQTVVGNWTTGYTISYTGIKELNATVRFTPPSIYVVTNVGVASLPDQNDAQAISFNSQQKQVIQVALSNSTVKHLVSQVSYYVESVSQIPFAQGNSTNAGDYVVTLFQANGSRFMDVWVNQSITTVLNIYTGNRTMDF
jgi:hypothetical protein